MRREEPDLIWLIEAVEKDLAKHHSPASNMMNIISHIKYKVKELIANKSGEA